MSLDGKRWRWEVCGTGSGSAAVGAAAAERDAWVAAVEAQILASLQGRVSHLLWTYYFMDTSFKCLKFETIS